MASEPVGRACGARLAGGGCVGGGDPPPTPPTRPFGPRRGRYAAAHGGMRHPVGAGRLPHAPRCPPKPAPVPGIRWGRAWGGAGVRKKNRFAKKILQILA